MLGAHRVTPVLLAKDLSAAREFYDDKIGLEILNENEDAIVFKCGGGTHLDVTKSTVGTADEQTQAFRQVQDIHAEIAELRPCGVQVEDYDLPGLKTDDGVADIGFARAAGSPTPARTHWASCKSRPSGDASGPHVRLRSGTMARAIPERGGAVNWLV